MFDKKEYQKQWRKENSEKIKEYRRLYRLNNPEKLKEYSKQYYERNFERIKGIFHKYYIENKGEFKKRNKIWHKNNPEKTKAYSKQYREDNKEGIRLKFKQYYIENRERILKQNRQWQKDNSEEILKSSKRYRDNNPNVIKKWKKNHPDYANQYMKNRCKIDIKFNLNCKISKAIRISLNGNKAGRSWETLVGYTLTDLFKRLKKTLPKRYTWQDYMKGELHIDHIIPIDAFNFTRPEHTDFKRCWALSNLRLLPAKENLIKSNNLIRPFQPALAI